MLNFGNLDYEILFSGLIPRIEEPSDGYDTYPRPIEPELDPSKLALGHIAYMGDFDRSK